MTFYSCVGLLCVLLCRVYTAALSNIYFWSFHLEIWERGHLPILHAFIDHDTLLDLIQSGFCNPLGLDLGICSCWVCVAKL